MKAGFESYILKFKQASGTSRGVLKTKKTYFLKVENQGYRGIGECALFEGLSADDVPNYEEILHWTCQNIQSDPKKLYEELRPFPSIQIGVEQALLNLSNGEDVYFENNFSRGEKGIPINGLIWMGDISFMKSQFEEKIKQGYRCIKFKIGVDREKEHQLLKEIRKQYPKEILEIRVDANGAFDEKSIESVLDDLAKLKVHSIEQPIKAGNWKLMSDLCKKTPTPIALDEELIGVFYPDEKEKLLQEINPQFIVLKPSLVGGFQGTKEWINFAKKLNIGWWITSALESNIGLNAIAQFTAELQTHIPQGLGTGGLFTNNKPAKLKIKNAALWHSK